MRKIVKLNEKDLSRIIKRVIKEDRERFTLDEITAQEGKSGTWRIENGSLILDDGTDLEMHIVNS